MSLAAAIHLGSVRPELRRRHALRGRRLWALATLVVADLASIFVGFAAAAYFRFGVTDLDMARGTMVSIIPLFLIFNGKAYRAAALQSWSRAFVQALGALGLAFFVTAGISFSFKANLGTSRLLLIYTFVIASGCLLVCRFLLGHAFQRLFKGQVIARAMIVDGVEPPRSEFGDALFLPIYTSDDSAMRDPRFLDKLSHVLGQFDDVLIACPENRRAGWAMALRAINVRGELLVPELDAIGGVGQHKLFGCSTVLVSVGPMALADRAMKRALDIVVAGSALVLFAPLMLVTAVAVALESGRPVLFRQQRLGYGNKLFVMLKFRSMRTDACDDKGRKSASRDDPRVTRVGRFIRATSIDELPQLFNVLSGKMSIVGPRPHALESRAGDQLFWTVDRQYFRRHACKPGLTGLAQVRGFRGATHRREDLERRLQADLEYLNDWTIMRDIVIMLSTVKVVMHRNAY